MLPVLWPSLAGLSLPSWFGLMLLMIFYGYFRGLLSPEALSTKANLYVQSVEFVRYTRINTIDALLNWKFWILLDALRHLVLPVITLTVVQCALVMRIMRSSATGRYLYVDSHSNSGHGDCYCPRAQP